MGGGLAQIVARGSQDIYLNSDPQTTYFRVKYNTHTNFSTEYITPNTTYNLRTNNTSQQKPTYMNDDDIEIMILIRDFGKLTINGNNENKIDIITQ